MKKTLTLLSALLGALWAPAASAQDHQVNLDIRVQFRNTLTAVEDGTVENQFQIRRARINVEGYAFDPHNEFSIQLGLSPRDLGLRDGAVTYTPLLDYYLNLTHLSDFSVMIGQYKVPFSRERIMSSGDLALVDRSLSASTLDIERDVGITFHSQDLLGENCLRYYLGVYSGLGRDGFLSQDVTEMSPLIITRMEFHPTGLFNNNDQLDFDRHRPGRVAFGFGYALTGQTHRGTLDAVFQMQGVSVEAAAIARTDLSTNDSELGYYLQIGAVVPGVDFAGGALRFGQVLPVEGAGIAERYELGGALSYYFERHKMKLQADLVHYWLGDFTVGEQQFRVQLQVGM